MLFRKQCCQRTMQAEDCPCSFLCHLEMMTYLIIFFKIAYLISPSFHSRVCKERDKRKQVIFCNCFPFLPIFFILTHVSDCIKMQTMLSVDLLLHSSHRSVVDYLAQVRNGRNCLRKFSCTYLLLVPMFAKQNINVGFWT